ncbi:NAD(P)-binding Rossmann-fold superfamily protein, putative isoform 2 [Hibiscus syriacus]|uniref:NAD(P)-binding Rossmann-fold superfamily protein, putative isoform 2 n=1 Tax=Hibiscus syriacus TaxID=106335 RepID=A0A6A3D0L9_HIBSY|nr:NAD(P)-binding Rossmann-fold superfamily protein, putative isoform 2 [Hibiscus syriacus]
METKVCVTGAAGYLGSSLVKRLLEIGYIVHATKRNLGDSEKVGLLKSLPHAETRMQINPRFILLQAYASSKAASGKELLRYGNEISLVHSRKPVHADFTSHKEQIVVQHPEIFGGIVGKSSDLARRGCLRRSHILHGEAIDEWQIPLR